MKTVVITGSARGFGFELIKLFRQYNYNVVLCDISNELLNSAKNKLEEIKGNGKFYPIKQILQKKMMLNL